MHGDETDRIVRQSKYDIEFNAQRNENGDPSATTCSYSFAFPRRVCSLLNPLFLALLSCESIEEVEDLRVTLRRWERDGGSDEMGADGSRDGSTAGILEEEEAWAARTE